jgi:DNA-binding NarL/FixJ family response regulator
MAQIIHLTEGSVRNIVSGILKKLNLKDRTQLGIFAVKNDLI